MTAHTAGPWTYRGSLGPHSAPHLLDPYVVEDAGGTQIAIVTRWRSEEAKADARLIAAAPELLSALRGMVRLIERRSIFLQQAQEFQDATATLSKLESE